MLMVKGLTVTESKVDVKINDTSVGNIFPYTGADPNHWFTQIINIDSGTLQDGDNELQIEAVSWPKAGPGDIYDDFYLRDVVCIFQQRA